MVYPNDHFLKILYFHFSILQLYSNRILIFFLFLNFCIGMVQKALVPQLHWVLFKKKKDTSQL